MGRPGNPEKSGSRRARRAWAIGLGAALALGCRSSTEFVEAELRYQCRRAAELERQVEGKDAEIVTLKAAVSNLQQATAAKPAPETTEEVYRKTALARIELAIMSGGKDMDGDGKDDGVQAAISPMDFDGDVFKCPGSVKLALFENLNSGIRKPLGEWTFDADRTRDSWQSSLMGAGYRLYAPWIEAPRVKKVRMVVTFTTLDGREFGAEKDFEVSLAAKRPPKTPPSDPAPPKPDVMTKTAQDSPPKLTIAEKPAAPRPEKHAEKKPKENGAAAFKPAELASLRMLPPAPAAARLSVRPPPKAKPAEK
ncbi:MAG TPA: hypothetical protein VNC50_09735, partial [Planctomycetia bacterium]|nr:hypothetical protein [Planctomycetia bacterium]